MTAAERQIDPGLSPPVTDLKHFPAFRVFLHAARKHVRLMNGEFLLVSSIQTFVRYTPQVEQPEDDEAETTQGLIET
jgi:hypothetical protein